MTHGQLPTDIWARIIVLSCGGSSHSSHDGHYDEDEVLLARLAGLSPAIHATLITHHPISHRADVLGTRVGISDALNCLLGLLHPRDHQVHDRDRHRRHRRNSCDVAKPGPSAAAIKRLMCINPSDNEEDDEDDDEDDDQDENDEGSDSDDDDDFSDMTDASQPQQQQEERLCSTTRKDPFESWRDPRLVACLLSRGARLPSLTINSLELETYPEAYVPLLDKPSVTALMWRVMLQHLGQRHSRGDDLWRDGLLLREAVRRGRADVVKVLIESGADVHHRADECLRMASTRGDTQTVQTLLAHDADPTALENAAIFNAAHMRHHHTFAVLLSHLFLLLNDSNNNSNSSAEEITRHGRTLGDCVRHDSSLINVIRSLHLPLSSTTTAPISASA